MTLKTRVVPMVLALFSVVVLDACRRRSAPEPVVDTMAERLAREDSIRQEEERRRREAEEARRRFVDDSIARARAGEDAMRRDSESLRATLAAPISFDFDRSDLRDDARASLDAKIPILLANSNVTIRVSGHADERGSSEYNLALGQRRAATAKRYLVERGVAEGRVETTSFGEERPICSESSEMCWSQNRRDEFEITGGGPALARPR
jgi:peptidoglycan-associated lipoprotein